MVQLSSALAPREQRVSGDSHGADHASSCPLCALVSSCPAVCGGALSCPRVLVSCTAQNFFSEVNGIKRDFDAMGERPPGHAAPRAQQSGEGRPVAWVWVSTFGAAHLLPAYS